VRILFAFTGGRGHLEPLVPIARAARDAGHTVAFASPPRMAAKVEELGFAVFPIGEAPPPKPPERKPLREVDLEREEREFREWFADQGARERAPGVLALIGEWRPDVVVAEETDLGSLVAAERAGVPYAMVLVLAAGTFVRPDLVAEPLNALRAELGLAPDPQLEGLSRHLVLSPFPPSFRDPAFPLPATAHSFRSLDATHDGTRGKPLVYFTLGTVFNLESGDLFTRVLEGLRELPVDVIATTGPRIDPAEFGPVADNVRLEAYVPQADVLPRASAVVSHGGSGTVVAALAHGLPQVLIPMGADQEPNARRCEALGVALVLDALAATPADVAGGVTIVLSDPSYRTAAERVRDEIAALPGPEHTVTLLEQLR
jgi:UDP:flavonoid glycosyltransferase YjiC (YdhE family)